MTNMSSFSISDMQKTAVSRKFHSIAPASTVWPECKAINEFMKKWRRLLRVLWNLSMWPLRHLRHPSLRALRLWQGATIHLVLDRHALLALTNHQVSSRYLLREN